MPDSTVLLPFQPASMSTAQLAAVSYLAAVARSDVSVGVGMTPPQCRGRHDCRSISQLLFAAVLRGPLAARTVTCHTRPIAY